MIAVLMFATTYPVIASEFNDLKNATWLVTSFALAGAATQTLVRHEKVLCSTKWD